jgi:1,4-dihydroxy-2-naphthoate octaprenyltransferase/chlorophyll synthase
MSASIPNRPLPQSPIDRWFYALKPASWPKLVVPALFGQLLGAFVSGDFDLVASMWGLGFTASGLAFIVLLNDWGDRDVDQIKRHMFPDGCSPKTIPDDILPARAVGLAGLSCGLLTAVIAVGAEISLGHDHALELGVGCMLLFVAYTLPPLRLNYRGGGELLEMLGVGVALPLFNVYLQAGRIPPTVLPWVSGFAFLSLGSGIASGLADEQSDRVGGKRTIASSWGNHAARRLTELSVAMGAACWVAGAIVRPDWVPAWAAVPALVILVWNFVAMRRLSKRAVTNAFAAQAQYKRSLHRAIWHSTTVAAVLLWLYSTLA